MLTPLRHPRAIARAVIACTALTSAALMSTRVARAEDKPELSFSAKEVSGDARLRELRLQGDVVVTYERFRLTSPELTLQRTARGIEVRGPGEVVFCPCPDPPVSIGFAGGIVAPPADLLLEKPSLRVGGWTIFVLPWFWMRAPSKPGILPPNVAYRGADGLLIGEGVHLPWKDGDDYDALDVTAAAYLKGGFELVTRFWTPRSTNRIRWDHLGGDLVSVDAHGAYPQNDDGAVAWDIDAIRGERARSAALSLAEAARGYDRARGEAMIRLSDVGIVSAGVRGMGARGASGPSERVTWGPTTALALGSGLGSFGTWDSLSTLTLLDDRTLGATSLARSEGGAEVAARFSPFVLRWALRESLTLASAGEVSSLDALAATRLEIASPLGRTYGAEGTPVVHVIEPRLRASLMTAKTSGSYFSATGRPLALGSGQRIMGSAGFRTAWGRLLGHAGGSVDADVGGIGNIEGQGISETTPLARARLAWSSRFLGFGGDGAAALNASEGKVIVGRVRLGEEDGLHVAVRAAGREGINPVSARALSNTTAQEPSGGWLSHEGWSGGAEIGARFGRSVGARISAEEDLTARTLLEVRGSLGYAHPCRCIAVDAFAGRRLGREGIDVWVAIDLAPR